MSYVTFSSENVGENVCLYQLHKSTTCDSSQLIDKIYKQQDQIMHDADRDPGELFPIFDDTGNLIGCIQYKRDASIASNQQILSSGNHHTDLKTEIYDTTPMPDDHIDLYAIHPFEEFIDR